MEKSEYIKPQKKDKVTNKDLKNEIIKAVENNHLWINAFMLVNPSDELKKTIGSWVINSLRNKENLLPMLLSDDNEKITEIQKLTPVFYCSINAS